MQLIFCSEYVYFGYKTSLALPGISSLWTLDFVFFSNSPRAALYMVTTSQEEQDLTVLHQRSQKGKIASQHTHKQSR